MDILEKLKLVEEHFMNISVEEFEKNLEDLGVEDYIDLDISYEIKNAMLDYKVNINDVYVSDNLNMAYCSSVLSKWEELAA